MNTRITSMYVCLKCFLKQNQILNDNTFRENDVKNDHPVHTYKNPDSYHRRLHNKKKNVYIHVERAS